jgi:hypothetical protein
MAVFVKVWLAVSYIQLMDIALFIEISTSIGELHATASYFLFIYRKN